MYLVQRIENFNIRYENFLVKRNNPNSNVVDLEKEYDELNAENNDLIIDCQLNAWLDGLIKSYRFNDILNCEGWL